MRRMLFWFSFTNTVHNSRDVEKGIIATWLHLFYSFPLLTVLLLLTILMMQPIPPPPPSNFLRLYYLGQAMLRIPSGWVPGVQIVMTIFYRRMWAFSCPVPSSYTPNSPLWTQMLRVKDKSLKPVQWRVWDWLINWCWWKMDPANWDKVNFPPKY